MRRPMRTSRYWRGEARRLRAEVRAQVANYFPCIDEVLPISFVSLPCDDKDCLGATYFGADARIEVSKEFHLAYGWEVTLITLRHELCHYALWRQAGSISSGRYRQEHRSLEPEVPPWTEGSPVFQEELKRVGADGPVPPRPSRKVPWWARVVMRVVIWIAGSLWG